MAGKGSTYRRVNPQKYAKGYAAAFGRCKDHPTYKAMRPPRVDCIVCRRLWREVCLSSSE